MSDAQVIDLEPDTPEDLFTKINPCPLCGAHQIEAPEREARTALHCFKCGYSPKILWSLQARNAQAQQVNVAAMVEQIRASVVEDLLKALSERGLVAQPAPAAVPAPQTAAPETPPATTGYAPPFGVS